MGLLKPFKVLLCDEITVDLDILGRLDLLNFLKQECEQRGATVVYATHIFDGMEPWTTHIAFTSDGKLVHGGKKEDVGDLKGVRHLLSTVYDWLVVDRNDRKEREKLEKANPKPKSTWRAGSGPDTWHITDDSVTRRAIAHFAGGERTGHC